MSGRILVLDDEENYAEMLQDLLRDNDYRVDMATRPERGIAQLEEIPYDLVISDYKMPVMDGSDFLKKARELYPNLPFILVSGLMNTPELVKVANMGVTLVMEKPLDTTAFLDCVSRFSSPMTEEEKAQLALEAQGSEEEVGDQSYPEEPRFFSANNFLANRFLQSAWSIARDSSELYLMEPSGGDAELFLKDLSVWRDNGDAPVVTLPLPATEDQGVDYVRDLLSGFDRSHVVGFRIDSVDAIARCRSLTTRIRQEVQGSERLLLVYLLESDSDRFAFSQAAPADGLVVPRLCGRPSDLAVYARRFARIAAERSGHAPRGFFTPEAIYLLLSYDWPNNYQEVQKVIRQAGEECGAEPIRAEVLRQLLGSAPAEPIEAEDRIASLMRLAQRRDLEDQMAEYSLSASEVSERLELDSKLLTEQEMGLMPLIKSELAYF